MAHKITKSLIRNLLNSGNKSFPLSYQAVRYLSVKTSDAKKSKFVQIFDNPLDAVKDIQSGQTLLVGGFGLCGVPENLIEALAKRNLKDFTIISNEGGVSWHGLDIMIEQKQIKKMVCSFIGENKEFERQFLSGELEVELTPQGNLAEKIRAAAAGVPAFYTPTGVNTLVHLGGCPIKFHTDGTIQIRSKPKESRVFNGHTYMLEEAVSADYSLIRGWKADRAGNVVFRNTATNFNPIMGRVGKITIAEVEEIVDIGELDPNNIQLPGIYVDRLVKGEPSHFIEKKVFKKEGKKARFNPVRETIARRAALEFKNGTFANLGIGLPMLVADFIPKDMDVFLHAENGILGLGPYPTEDKVDSDTINPGKETVSILPGGSYFGSDESFSMIRGHHLHFTMLGAMQISAHGDLANWMIPGKKVKGMGGAMDLVASKSKVIVLTTHTSKNGEPKIVRNCTLPLTGSKCIDTIITEKCVFNVDPEEGLTLIELADGVEIKDITNSTACTFKVAKDLKPMGQI